MWKKWPLPPQKAVTPEGSGAGVMELQGREFCWAGSQREARAGAREGAVALALPWELHGNSENFL